MFTICVPCLVPSGCSGPTDATAEVLVDYSRDPAYPCPRTYTVYQTWINPCPVAYAISYVLEGYFDGALVITSAPVPATLAAGTTTYLGPDNLGPIDVGTGATALAYVRVIVTWPDSTVTTADSALDVAVGCD